MSVPAMAAEVSVSDAVPKTTGSVPGLTANANPLNTPPATGLLTNPQAPSGAVNTNTGRSVESTYTYMSTKLNILNVGTKPGAAKN